MISFQAIHDLYPEVKSIVDGVAFDAEGNVFEYDVVAVEAYVAARAYRQKRAAEYPPITDYLDGVVKGDQDQIDAYIAACLAVKAKYPK